MTTQNIRRRRYDESDLKLMAVIVGLSKTPEQREQEAVKFNPKRFNLVPNPLAKVSDNSNDLFSLTGRFKLSQKNKKLAV